VEVATGEIAWRDRRFTRANLLTVGDRILVLDEEGTLGLVSLSPRGLEVHAKHRLVEDLARTPPSLVGDRLYVRTPRELLAVELP
jgi:hypothetical protein